MASARTMSKKQRAPSADEDRHPWWRLTDANVPRLRHARTRRVLLMLVLIWIVGIFDLVFTLIALQIGGFQEANPLARHFIHSPALLATFKFTTLGLATPILVIFSRRRLTEVACWVVAVVYVGLAFLWLAYYIP
jgi:hypothetical protein